MTEEVRKLKKTSFAIPFTQFDWGDYYADTDYLSFEEHGMYWNLLRRYYTTGPFTSDLNDLKRKMRYLEKDNSLLEAVLNEFFYLSEEDGCWHHKRCDEEITRVKGISEIQSQRARKAMQSKQRIAGCYKKTYSGSGNSTCSWKPTAQGYREITVIYKPTDNTYSEVTSKKTFWVYKRTTTR